MYYTPFKKYVRTVIMKVSAVLVFQGNTSFKFSCVGGSGLSLAL